MSLKLGKKVLYISEVTKIRKGVRLGSKIQQMSGICKGELKKKINVRDSKIARPCNGVPKVALRQPQKATLESSSIIPDSAIINLFKKRCRKQNSSKAEEVQNSLPLYLFKYINICVYISIYKCNFCVFLS